MGFSEYNSSNWTVSVPSRALRSAGHKVKICHIREWLSNSPYAKYLVSNSDIATVQRVMIEESIESVKYWRNKDKSVVLSFDDGYMQLAESKTKENPAISFWVDSSVEMHVGGTKYKKHIGYDPIDKLREGLSYCSAGTVPSKVLASDYKEYNDMFHLRNYADSSLYVNRHKREHGDDIYIGWGGSMGHHESWLYSGILESLKRVFRERDNVKLFFIGDHRLVPKLGISERNVVFRPYVPYFRWPDTLMNYDISVAPLSGSFDRRRSFIKGLEASLVKIPFIATGDEKYPVYEEFFNSPAHIYVPSELTVPDYDERVQLWYEAFNQMIDNLEFYREKTEESFEIGMEYDVNRNVDNIINVYEEIIRIDS